MDRWLDIVKGAAGMMIAGECLLVLASPLCMDAYMQHWVATSPWMILFWSPFCLAGSYVLSANPSRHIL